jgi:hypothetical protein
MLVSEIDDLHAGIDPALAEVALALALPTD